MKSNKITFKFSIPKRLLRSALLVLLIVNIGLFAVWIKGKVGEQKPKPGSYPEGAELSGKELTFKDLSVYFTSLAEDRGVAYAFEA